MLEATSNQQTWLLLGQRQQRLMAGQGAEESSTVLGRKGNKWKEAMAGI